MSEFIDNTLQPYFNFWIYVILMMIGLWALIAKNNLIKKLIGLSIFQTAIILFYVSLGVKEGATIPILDHHGDHGHGAETEHHPEAGHEAAADHHGENGETSHAEEAGSHAESQGEGDGLKGEYTPEAHIDSTSPDPDKIANPLPHVLMLTAIVVGVATLGVALAISQMIFKEFGSLEEDEILEELKSGNVDG